MFSYNFLIIFKFVMSDNETFEASKYFLDSKFVIESQTSMENDVSNLRRSSRKRKARNKGNGKDICTKKDISFDVPTKVQVHHEEQASAHVSLSCKLTEMDFNKCGINLAKYLLGKVLTRVYDNGDILSGRIVETEAYLGETDRACHTYGGKRTERTQPMYMNPGTLYVYFIYGMYHCLNISSQDVGGCVLIRALDPIQGKDMMKKLRCARSKSSKPNIKDSTLCNGPSKLCVALAITKEHLNKEYLATSDKIWIEKDENLNDRFDIVVTKRIGIDSYGQEWASKPFRFYILGNRCVSVRDRNAEAETLHSDVNQ